MGDTAAGGDTAAAEEGGEEASKIDGETAGRRVDETIIFLITKVKEQTMRLYRTTVYNTLEVFLYP